MGCEPPAPPAKADALPGVSWLPDLAGAPAAAILRLDSSFPADDLESDEDCEAVERPAPAVDAADFVDAAVVDFVSVLVLADAEAASFFAASFFAASFFGGSFFAASLFPVSLACEPEENSRVKKFPDVCSVL